VPEAVRPNRLVSLPMQRHPGRFAADRDYLERYASDPEYRASLIRRKAWEKNAGN
jgi:hypothetical protein